MPEAVEQPEFGRPIQQLRALHRVTLQQIQDMGPGLDNIGRPRIRVQGVK